MQIGGKGLYTACSGTGDDRVFFNGSIDEVAVYDKVLSSQEILDHYRLAEGKYHWKVNTTDGSLSNESEVWEFTIDSSPPEVTLNTPVNASTISSTWSILNATVTDNLQNMTVYFYANNNPDGLNASDGLVYIAENVTNASHVPYNLTALPLKPSEEGLVLLYHFDNRSEFGENSTHVYDFTGNGNNATCSGTYCPTWNSTGGPFAGAFDFDGVNDYLTVLDSPSLNITGAITISAWIRPRTLLNWNSIVDKGGGSGYGLAWDGAGNCGGMNTSTDSLFLFYGGTRWNYDCVDYLSNNSMQYVVGTYNLTHFSYYINGEGYSTNIPRTGQSNSLNLTIGNKDTFYFNGTMDELAIYNRSLSAAEVLDHYRLAQGKYYWKVNATDSSLSNESSTWEFTINAMPHITLNSPVNQSIINQDYTVLNATVTDEGNDTTTVYFYASDNSNGLNASEGLVSIVHNVTNASNVTYNLTALPLKPSEEGLVLLYHFDNRSEFGENSTHVYDYSGNGNNATCSGTACPTWNYTGGPFAGAFDFDGVNDYLTVLDSPSLNITGAITISAWIRPRSLEGWVYIVDKGGNSGYGLGWDGGGNCPGISKPLFLSYGGDTWTYTCGNYLSNNTMQYVVGTYNLTHFSYYINGKGYSRNISMQGLHNSLNLYIGNNSIFYFNGTMDELAIYNRSLSAAEVLDHYRLAEGKYYWKVNATDGWLSNESSTWEFTIRYPKPEFQVTNITFTYAGNSSDISETGTGDHIKGNTNVTVNATIHNYGDNYTGTDVYVGFYDGESGQAGRQFANATLRNSTGGTYILQNTDNYAVGYWNPSLVGTHTISAWADWTNATGEDSAANETNNNNSRLINVSAWQKYWGNVSGNIVLASSSGDKMYQWDWSNTTDMGYIFMVNSGNSVNWISLHGLGSDSDNDLNVSGNDFYEADTALNLKPGSNNATGFLNNNITQLFSGGGSNNATNTTYFIIRGTNITNVPVINSTNMTDHRNVETANFITGLFWDQDSGTGVDYYDGSQNLVFAGKVRPHTSGLPGITQVHTYEVAIPSALNATIGGTMEFYVELK